MGSPQEPKEEHVAELPRYEGKTAEKFPDVEFDPLFFVQSSLLWFKEQIQLFGK